MKTSAQMLDEIDRLEDENASLKRQLAVVVGHRDEMAALVREAWGELKSLRVRLAAARTWIAEETDFQSRTTSDDRWQW